MKRVLIVGLGLFLITGCSVRKMAVRSMAPVMQDATLAFYQEPDWELAKAAYPSNLKLIEGLLETDPHNTQFLTMAAEGYASAAYGFLELENQLERAQLFYLRAAGLGLRALAKEVDSFDTSKVLSVLRATQWNEILSGSKRKQVPTLFWLAYAWGGWVNLNRDDMRAIGDLPNIVNIMQRVTELQPDFFFHGADMFMGAYYCNRPRLLGGDPSKGIKTLEAVFTKHHQHYLVPKLLIAEYCAPAILDRDLFEHSVKQIIDLPLEALPAQRLANTIAKRRAAILMEKIDETFD